MDLEEISQVLEVDRESYKIPWPASAYRREILHNRNARYYVLREVDDGELAHHKPDSDGDSEDHSRSPFSFLRWPLRSSDGQQDRRDRVLGYAGMWLMVDEAHITTIAMRTAWRGRGLGELLLVCLIDTARDLGIRRMTLEVRVSNESAQNLYRKYGFDQAGVRPRYYSDNNEDAYIMTTGDVQSSAYRDNFDQRVRALRRRLVDGSDMSIIAPPFGSAQVEHVKGSE
jgi:ribosomal-protein-alanine N-acetyltransferase